MGAAFSGRPRNNGARSERTYQATAARRTRHIPPARRSQAPRRPAGRPGQPQSGSLLGNDPGRGPQQQGHRAASAASQWRMDFRKSLLGTRTRSVGQTSTPLFQEGSKNGPAEDWRMHSKPPTGTLPLPTPPSVSGAELGNLCL